MSNKASSSIDRDQTAADWVARLGSDQSTASDHEQFKAWCEENADNAAEYAALAEIWQAVGSLSKNVEARAILLRSVPRRSVTRRWWLGGAAAAAAAGALWTVPRLFVQTDEFRSARGERREVQLADGSTLILNTDSHVKVSLLAAERCVFLEQGQCFLKVAKDARRPFRVFVDGHEVRALGTAFDVYKAADAVQVTMTEGTVAIYGERIRKSDISIYERVVGVPFAEEKAAAVLSAGKQAKINANASIDIRDVNLSRTETWREGKLVFEEVQLGDAVREVNRYIAQQIVLSDSSLAVLKVSGTFQIGHLEQFAHALSEMFGLRSQDQGNTTVLLREI